MASPGSACTASPGPWDPRPGCALASWESREHTGSSKGLPYRHYAPAQARASEQHLNYSHTV